jgi:protein ImuA
MGDAALSALRNLLSPQELTGWQTRAPLGHEDTDAALKGGLVKGALHEVFAFDSSHAGAASGFASCLALRVGGNKKLLWIRQDFSALEFGELNATGLLELGLDPDRVIVVRAADASGVLRAAGEGLACAALGAVIAEIPQEPKILDLVASRRLNFAAAREGVTALLVRLAAEPDASAAETRWVVRAARSANNDDWGAPVFAAELVRNRHGETGNWVMEWSIDHGIFREPAADSRAHAAASADRPAAAARAG